MQIWKKEWSNQLANWMIRLSPRERWLMLALVGGGLIWGCYATIDFCEQAFAGQNQRLEDLSRNRKWLPESITRYKSLKKRQTAIEYKFRSSEQREDVPSYVEGLFGKFMQSTGTNLTINNQPIANLGEEFQLLPYSIRFQANAFDTVVKFLQELTIGVQPLIIKELELTKTVGGDKYDIALKVATINKKIPSTMPAKTGQFLNPNL